MNNKPLLIILALGGNICKTNGRYEDGVVPLSQLCHAGFTGRLLPGFSTGLGKLLTDNFSGVMTEIITLKESDDLTGNDMGQLRLTLNAVLDRFGAVQAARILIAVGGNRLLNVANYLQEEKLEISTEPSHDRVKMSTAREIGPSSMITYGDDYIHMGHHDPLPICLVSTTAEIVSDDNPISINRRAEDTIMVALTELTPTTPVLLTCVWERELATAPTG